MAKIFLRLLKAFGKIFIACIVFIIGLSACEAIRQFFETIPIATETLFGFITRNPIVLVVCFVCLFTASIFYDQLKVRIKKLIMQIKKRTEQSRKKNDSKSN